MSDYRRTITIEVRDGSPDEYLAEDELLKRIQAALDEDNMELLNMDVTEAKPV